MNKTFSPGRQRLAVAGAVLIALITFAVVGSFWFIGPDYLFHYRPVAVALMTEPASIYTTGPHHFLAPWGPLLLVPTLPLPLSYAQLLLNFVSFLGVFQAARIVPNVPRMIVLLGVMNLHTFDLILRGNVDGLIALGLFIAWMGLQRRKPLWLGMGLWLMAIKPVNIALPAIFYLAALRNWTWRERVIVVLPVMVSVAASLLIFGVDLPIRYMMLRESFQPLVYLQTSPWRVFDVFGISRVYLYGLIAISWVLTVVIILRHSQPSLSVLAVALAVNLTFTVYSLGYHYVLLAPVFVLLATWNRWWLLTWLLTLTPLLRIPYGFDVVVIDHLYPLVLLIGAVAYYVNSLKDAAHLQTE